MPPLPRRKRVPLPAIDLASVAIATDVPVPQHRAANGPEWPVLLARLTVAGMHSSPLPITYRQSLKAAAAKWAKEHGGKYTVREISATHMRIWRTE